MISIYMNKPWIIMIYPKIVEAIMEKLGSGASFWINFWRLSHQAELKAAPPARNHGLVREVWYERGMRLPKGRHIETRFLHTIFTATTWQKTFINLNAWSLFHKFVEHEFALTALNIWKKKQPSPVMIWMRSDFRWFQPKKNTSSFSRLGSFPLSSVASRLRSSSLSR